MSGQAESIDLQFEWEPPSELIRSDELRFTFARLEIWIGGQCLTLGEDVLTGSARRSIHVSLYPLAEWIAFNWWRILADGRPAWQRRVQGRSVVQPSNLRSVGDGFAWPDLAIVAERDSTILRWQPWVEKGSPYPVRFIGRGEATIPVEAVERSLAQFVDLVLDRLKDSGVDGTPLESEWEALRILDDEEVEFCRASAQLGLDPFAEGADVAESLEEVFAQLEPSIRDEFLDSVDPTHITSSLRWIHRASKVRAGRGPAQPSLDVAHLGPVVQSSASGRQNRRPWEVGYEAARQVRLSLDTAPTAAVNLHASLRVVDVPIEDRGLVALGRAGKLPTVVLGQPRVTASRSFVLARSIWGFLAGSESCFLLTAAHSPEQQISRAFAAELLAPAAGIQELLGGDTVDTSDESVLDVADHFGVSGLVIRHQLENQVLPRSN